MLTTLPFLSPGAILLLNEFGTFRAQQSSQPLLLRWV